MDAAIKTYRMDSIEEQHFHTAKTRITSYVITKVPHKITKEEIRESVNLKVLP